LENQLDCCDVRNADDDDDDDYANNNNNSRFNERNIFMSRGKEDNAFTIVQLHSSVCWILSERQLKTADWKHCLLLKNSGLTYI